MKTMKEPLKKDFGYQESNHPEEETGWLLEGGEEAYEIMMEKYNFYMQGFNDAQEFIPIMGCELPIGEDVIIRTWRNNVYFGCFIDVRSGIVFRPDLQTDETEDVKLELVKEYKPVIYPIE